MHVERDKENHKYNMFFQDKLELALVLGGIRLYQSTWLKKGERSDSPEAFYSVAGTIGNLIAGMELDTKESEKKEAVCSVTEDEMVGILYTTVMMMAMEMNETERQREQLLHYEKMIEDLKNETDR